MRITRYLSKILHKTLYESKDIIIFEYDKDKQGEGKIDPDIKIFKNYNEIDKSLRKKILPYPFINPLYYRLKNNNTQFLCLVKNNEVLAWGWVQSCKSLLKKFYNNLAFNGLLLGPFWTNPLYRGQGLYGRLLKHSIAVIDKTKPILISTRVDNLSSIAGIQKEGFKLLGIFSVLTVLFFYVKYKKKREANKLNIS